VSYIDWLVGAIHDSF